MKVRGSAQQVLEKYLALARDASSSGDRVNAESYLQYAEHYYRVLTANQQNAQQGQPGSNGGRRTGLSRVSLDDDSMIDDEETQEGEEAEVAEVAETEEPQAEAPKPKRRGRKPAKAASEAEGGEPKEEAVTA